MGQFNDIISGYSVHHDSLATRIDTNGFIFKVPFYW